MKLLTKAIHAKLLANGIATRTAQAEGRAEPDHHPVVKYFNPCGAATWLITELDADGDTLFGLCDLGFGTPELGSVSLAELGDIVLRFGLGIERDLHFHATKPLSAYAEQARERGPIAA